MGPVPLVGGGFKIDPILKPPSSLYGQQGVRTIQAEASSRYFVRQGSDTRPWSLIPSAVRRSSMLYPKSSGILNRQTRRTLVAIWHVPFATILITIGLTHAALGTANDSHLVFRGRVCDHRTWEGSNI